MSTPQHKFLVAPLGRRGEARAESGARGDEVLGVEARAHSQPLPHQLRGLREHCKRLSWAAEGFSCILSRQIAFPTISVRVAYSLRGYL